MIIRKCLVCKSEFETNKSTKIYCCYKCNYRARKMRKNGIEVNIKPNNLCDICSSNNGVMLMAKANKFLCKKHYSQYRRHGKTIVTRYDKNDITSYDSYSDIIVKNKNGIVKAIFQIDNEDIDIVSKYKWTTDPNGYIINSTNNIRLHRLITNCPDEYEVDHINKNILDNRRSNLRIASRSQNNMNQCIKSNNTSGHKGVSWSKDKNKWVSYITINNKRMTLGRFCDISDAIKSRFDAEIKYFREFRHKGGEQSE